MNKDKTNTRSLAVKHILALLLLTSLTSVSCAAPAAKPTGSNSAQGKSTPGPPLRRSSKSKDTTILAQNSQALQPIIIAEKASESTTAVAAELAEYLKRITGATFEVKTGDGSTGIVLGTLAEFPNPELNKPLEIRNRFDGKEAYAIRTEPKRLLLIGATDSGVSHAAFRLLESLGCRWFFPAKEWEVVPGQPTLQTSINETDRPVLLSRRIWYGFGFFYDPGKSARETRAVVDYEAWGRHNRMGSSLQTNYGHAWQTIIADNKADFDAHPEYRALVGGKRRGDQLCVSSPEVRRIATRWALSHFQKSPHADMVSMEPSDGGDHCECENCARLGTVSDRVFGLANEVARAVTREYPGKLVGLYAYNEHSEPPAFQLEPNVYVQLTAGFTRGRYTFNELVELWPRKSRNMGYYDYFSFWYWDFDMLPGGRGGDVSYLRKQIPFYVAHQAVTLDAESGNNWGPHGRGYYIANKLMWNPKADVDALLTDFYEKAFGPAAAPMRRYYARFEPSSEPLMSEHLLGLGFRDIQEAGRLAAGRPDVQARLDHIKQYLRYVQLRWQLEREPEKEKKKALTLAALTHVYRTRYSYMNHWEAMRQGWMGQAASEFGEPTWSFLDATPNKPWAVEQPYTKDETERAFQEGLAHFQPQPITEKTFSRDLVPVRFEGTPTVASRQHYQNPLRYALYSVQGEPLVVDITTGTIEAYRDYAPARYTVVDARDARIAEARLPLDGKVHRLEIKVPRAGLYYLDFNDSSAGWIIEMAAERSTAVALRRARGSAAHAGWMQSIYFYVPKGTKELQYYWSGGHHRVHTPDGKIAQEVKVSGKFVTIPVPPGMDGKAWHFSQFALGHLWFFNVPNYLAASPNALLLPREVVEKDGVQMAR